MNQNDPVGIRPQAGDQVTNTAHEPVSGGGAGSMMPSFLAQLARAMQAAAELERERIAAVVADHAAEHVEKTQTRAAAETEELRRLAEEDIDRIQTWLADETERIRREADRRTEEHRNDLEALLAQHDSIIATEIDSIGAAVRDYRSTLDQFFDALRGATNPVDIARRAGSLPAPPDLDDVRGAARASAVAKLAEAPQDATDEPVGDGLGRAEADPPSSADADLVGDEWAEAGAGLAVMDPEAVGRSGDLLEAPEEVDAEAAAESATAPPADPQVVPVGHAMEGDVAESVGRSGPAVRLLRSIAPWTTLVEHDERDRGTENPPPPEF
jgi:hypothetical protein